MPIEGRTLSDWEYSDILLIVRFKLLDLDSIETKGFAMLMVIGALLLICMATSTKETRAAGREMIKPYARAAGIFAVVAWTIIIASLWQAW